jgi:hypothetical protein
MEYLNRAVNKGYSVLATLQHSREFDAIRSDAAFQALLSAAAARRDNALTAFREAGGHRLLGPGRATPDLDTGEWASGSGPPRS